MFKSWVTTITVVPFAAKSLSSLIISSEVTLSSAPVGSSAIIISGLLARDLAIATLCFCPPDSCVGFLLAKSSSPTCFSKSSALAFRSLSANSGFKYNGTFTFSITDI
ncbi:conserved hypothetical protein [Listeria monocytogenes str. 4b H7858]|nr:conserved hypothetical protein [Listeria monocytogenes str. 4b H7858] [Listeria monocytogenes serotype 4b str. H7858]